MIKHNNKRCSVSGCTNFLYARKYCLYHYKSLYLYPKQKNKDKVIYNIPKVSQKRQNLDREYDKKRESFIISERNKDPLKRIFCIFCGKEIEGDPSCHHGLGRDEDIMLDEKYWFLSHNTCHVHQYHSMGWRKIWWWMDYIARLIKLGCKEILEIEYKRMER